MKLNKTILTTTLATLLLIGCGGGSGGNDSSNEGDGTYEEPESYTLFMEKSEHPNTYECTLDSARADMYSLKSYFNNEADCNEYAHTWIANFTHEDTPTIDREQQQKGLDYINAIRANIGLVKFKHNKELEEANRLHEAYLVDIHNTFNGANTGHYEDNVNYPSEYYRGYEPIDRAIASGYSPISSWGEVMSFREKSSILSIDLLLTAIYHRQALLLNWVDEIGVGIGSGGRSGFHAEGHLFGLKSDNRVGFLQDISTDMVCFPYSMQGGIGRYFKGENPAPLPDIDYWTGNPISVTFNSMKVDNIELLSFKLYKTDRDDDGEGSDSADVEITNSRIMTVDTDPNDRFSKFDFALFPLDVLESKTVYKVVFKWIETINGVSEEKEKEWLFQTRE